MKREFAYTKLGPENCFQEYFEKNHEFVFWWIGAKLPQWRGSLEDLKKSLNNAQQMRTRPDKNLIVEAEHLWQTIRGVRDTICCAFFPSSLWLFQIAPGTEIEPVRDESVLEEWRKHRNKNYNPEFYTQNTELVSVRADEIKQISLASVPGLVSSLPCNNYISRRTFYVLGADEYKGHFPYSEHRRLLKLLRENSGRKLRVDQEKVFRFLSPKQLESVVALALIDRGVTGPCLTGGSMRTWDMIGKTNRQGCQKLPEPLRSLSEFYIQVKFQFEVKKTKECREILDQLEKDNGFLISPNLQEDEKQPGSTRLLGASWLHELVSSSELARRYLEGCVNDWIEIQPTEGAS